MRSRSNGTTRQSMAVRMLRVLLSAGIAMLMGATVSWAGMTWIHFLSLSGPDAIILDTDCDVVVATIESREGGGMTNGDPPRLRLRVIRILRGDPGVDRRHAVWLPFPNDVDDFGPAGLKRIAAWKRGPLPGPSPHEKFILVGDVEDRGDGPRFWIEPLGQFPYDAARCRWARRALGRIDGLRREEWEYAGAWYHEYTDAEVLDGARPVRGDTVLRRGQAVLWHSGGYLSRKRVVACLPNGRIRTRRDGEDSRWDRDEDRSDLLLYPESILEAEKAAARNSPPHSRDRNAW